MMFLTLLKLYFNIGKASFIFVFHTWADFQCPFERNMAHYLRKLDVNFCF